MRAPWLVAYWHDNRFILENYATGSRISADLLTAQILDFFGPRRSVAAAAASFPQFSPVSVTKVVRELERHSLLVAADGPVDVKTTALKAWSLWNPAAGFFHLSTKDVPFADRKLADEFLQRKARQSPEPPRFKRYAHAQRLPLPSSKTGAFPDVLLARRTWREFSQRPLSLDDLGTLLGLTWRVQGWLPKPGLQSRPLKTSPSGGARHPIEVYVLALRVRGLPRGLYHYAADRHQLELLRQGASSRQVVRYLPTQTWFKDASALMLMTAVFPRTQWKYTFARAYRVVLAEAGHLCQTFCLTATWLGLAPFCTMALADSRIERDLGIDGVTESILYAAGVGTRPR